MADSMWDIEDPEAFAAAFYGRYGYVPEDHPNAVTRRVMAKFTAALAARRQKEKIGVPQVKLK